ncbi:hypothetical protein [Comamonas sp.]|uniref:hypothetical protein n=1 Tax=Comamonas sp. TaxID=34028 RepID=UPI003A9164F4
MYFKKTLFVALVFNVLLLGCSESSGGSSVSNSVANEVQLQPAPKFGVEDWRKIVSESYVAENKKTDDDGRVDYSVCAIPKADGKCSFYFSGLRDNFNKVDIWSSPMIGASSTVGLISHLDLLMVLSECQSVVIVLTPQYVSDRKLLMMNKVALMADGEVVFEREIDTLQVQRSHEFDQFKEYWRIPIEPTDFAALERFAASKQKVARLSGDKGFVTLKKDVVGAFAFDLPHMTSATRTINERFAGASGPICQNSERQIK